jgi:hypothetical protein
LLSNNWIETITLKCSNLRFLFLKYNHLSFIDVSFIVNSVHLDISHNKLKNIKGLEKLTELVNLDVSYNYLSDIDISFNTSLESINIDGNLIDKLYIWDLTNLKNIININPLNELIIYCKNEEQYLTITKFSSDLTPKTQFRFLEFQETAISIDDWELKVFEHASLKNGASRGAYLFFSSAEYCFTVIDYDLNNWEFAKSFDSFAIKRESFLRCEKHLNNFYDFEKDVPLWETKTFAKVYLLIKYHWHKLNEAIPIFYE